MSRPSRLQSMPDYLIPQGGDEESTSRLRKFMVIMDSMNKAELDGKVKFNEKNDPSVESRIRRIAAGSGSHPNEVKMLLQAHRQFESVVSKIGKSGLAGAGSKVNKAQQQQMATMLKKNPNQIQQRLNQMDPRMLQSLGGRENVLAMMQQMARGGGPGGPGGGMPNMDTMQAMMQQMGGGGGGGMMPNMGGMDFASMMQQMSGGGNARR
jgi:signal recognition particle subunit SRP54